MLSDSIGTMVCKRCRQAAHCPKHFNDLKQVKKLYLTEKWEKEGVILSSLANLWIEELSKDEEVSYYITTQGIILKDEKLDKLTASLTNQETRNGQRIRRGLTKHKAVDGYIRRFCTSDQSENNFIYYVLGKKNVIHWLTMLRE